MRIQMKNKASLVLILVAGASLVSMLGTLSIDRIVNHTLYSYGLQFSYNWAIPYWTMAGVVFSMGWLIILTAIAYDLHLLMRWLRKPPKPETPNGNQVPVQREAPRIEAASTGKPEEEEAKVTTVTVKAENELGEFRVLQEEPVENEAPRTEPAPSEKPEEQEATTAEIVVKPEDEYRVPQKEPAQSETPRTEATTSGQQEEVQNEMSRAEILPSEKSEAEEVMTTEVAMKTRDESAESRKPQEEPAQNETPRIEACPTEKPDDKEAKRTALAVKAEDQLGDFLVLLDETSEMTKAKITRQKADNEPKKEE
jgi:hypothetical protein